MKRLRSAVVFAILFLRTTAFSAAGQTAESYNGKGIISSTFEDRICFGNVVTSEETFPRCSGSEVSSGGLTAISTLNTVEKLEQIRVLLESINNRLAPKPEAAPQGEKSPEQSSALPAPSLHEAVEKRFAEVPSEVFSSEGARQEISRLKTAILKEIDAQTSEGAAPPKK